jgi:hypothetical protein
MLALAVVGPWDGAVANVAVRWRPKRTSAGISNEHLF